MQDPVRFRESVQKMTVPGILRIKVTNLSYQHDTWQTAVFLGDRLLSRYGFTLPVSQLHSGYNRLEVTLEPLEKSESKNATLVGEFLQVGRGGSIIDFAILEKKQVAPNSSASVTV